MISPLKPRFIPALCLSLAVAAATASTGATASPAGEAVPSRTHRATELAAAPQDQQPEVVTRVYSLRPLIQAADSGSRAPRVAGSPFLEDVPLLSRFYGAAIAQPGPAAGGGGGMTPAAPAPMDQLVAPMARAAVADSGVVPQVIQIILTAIEPESWVDNGGEIGHMTYLPVQYSLVVTHTAEVQGRVAELLESIQDRRVVSMRAKLVRAEEAQINENVALEQGVAVWDGETIDLPPVAEVRYSGFDGQTQSASDGRRVPYLASVMPVVAANAVGYQTQVGEIHTGLTLRITPVLNQEGNQVTLEVDAEYLLLDEQGRPATRPAGEAAGPGGVLLPDRLTVDRRALDLSVRVPTGRWVLIGSLGASRDGEPATEAPLHLLVRIDTGAAPAAE